MKRALLALVLAACGGDPDDAPVDSGPPDIGVDVGRDTGVRDIGRDVHRDSSRDVDREADAWSSTPGWELIPGARCPAERALDPSTAYEMAWEPCETDAACQMQVLDERYSGDILPVRMGQRLPDAPIVIGFRAFEVDRPLSDTISTVVLAEANGRTTLAWRNPRASSNRGCLVGVSGSNGISAAIELFYPDETSDFFHAPLAELNTTSTPIGHLEPTEQLGTGAQYLTASATHVLAKMGSLIWVFDGERKVRRGGPRDIADATGAFESMVSILGDRIVGGLNGEHVSTFDRIDGPPTLLRSREGTDYLIYAATDDGENIIWLQSDGETRTEIWTSPHVTTPEAMRPRVIHEISTFRLPVLGDGIVAILDEGDILAIDLDTGRKRRIRPPEDHVFWTDLAAVSADEVVAVLSHRGERRARYIRYDLRAIPYEE